MKITFVAILAIAIVSCKTQPFVKHKLQFEKVADACNSMHDGIKMNSNLNGERYEFQRCLDVDFQKTQVSSVRHGDTIVLSFERKNPKQALYDLTVDLDAYPRYNFLTIDGSTIPIIPVGN